MFCTSKSLRITLPTLSNWRDCGFSTSKSAAASEGFFYLLSVYRKSTERSVSTALMSADKLEESNIAKFTTPFFLIHGRVPDEEL